MFIPRSNRRRGSSDDKATAASGPTPPPNALRAAASAVLAAAAIALPARCDFTPVRFRGIAEEPIKIQEIAKKFAGRELTAEELEAVREAALKAEVVKNPLIDRMLKAGRNKRVFRRDGFFSDAPERVERLLAASAFPLRAAFWGASAGLVLISVLFAATGSSRTLRGYASWTLTLCGWWLVCLSAAAAALLALEKINLWPGLPWESRILPVFLVVASAAALKVVAPGEPVWDAVRRSLLAPSVAALLMLAWHLV